jgi:hypothetical protein
MNSKWQRILKKGRKVLAIFNRFPKWPQVVAAYSVIVLVIYSWTILWFFWKLPGWLFFLSIGEILTIFAYSMMTNLFESLLVLCLPLGLCLILPRKWFSDVFVARSVIITLSVLGYAAYILTQFQSREDYPGGVVRLIPIVFLVSLLLAFLAGKVKILVKVIDFFAEQATIFLYITIPVSLVCLVVVLARLMF